MQLNLYKATRDRVFPPFLLLIMVRTSPASQGIIELIQREESSDKVTVLFTNSQIMNTCEAQQPVC